MATLTVGGMRVESIFHSIWNTEEIEEYRRDLEKQVAIGDREQGWLGETSR